MGQMFLNILLYFICTNQVTLKSLVPDISWEFTNMQNGKVLAKEKADNNDDTSVVTSRNFGDLLQGTTTAWDEPLKTQVAYFNGTSSGVLIPTLTGLCVLRPSTCLDGFSVAFWIKRVEWKSYFIFTSSSFGMKELVQDTAAVEVVDAENQKTWRVFVTIDTSNWQFFTMTWSQEDGITVYIDGVFKLNETNTVPTTYLATVNLAVAGDRLAFGTSVEDTRDEANVQMYFNKFMIWEHRLNTTEVEQVYQNALLQDVSNSRVSFSNIKDKDFALLNHVIKTIQVGNHVACYTECVRYGSKCLSYNFQYKLTTELTHVCELNNAARYDVATWKFQRKENFIYYEVS